jgi:DNA-binding transcriptional LysR family regulator
MSVGMASRHLQALEEELGVQLIRRTTRRIDLTPAGEEFLARTRAILKDLEDAKQAARTGHDVTGNAVVSVPGCLGFSVVVPLVTRLLETHPRLQIDLRFEDRAVNLLAEGIDIAIRSDVDIPSSHYVVTRRVVEYERVLCASPGFLERHGKVDSIADLARVPCILYATPNRASWRFQTPTGPEDVTVDGRIRTDNLLAALGATVEGVGVSWLPSWIAVGEFRRKRLKPVLPEARLAPMKVFAFTHKPDGIGRGAVGTVLDYLVEEIPREIDRRHGQSAKR